MLRSRRLCRRRRVPLSPIRGRKGHSESLPAYCRVEGVINRRTGVGGEEFGINFALAMPDTWNGDFLMQGGGGGNGIVLPPLGLVAAGPTPALLRGFAVVSTDTGHKGHRGPFDFDFMRDQQAYLDFAYLANAERKRKLPKQLDLAALRQTCSLFLFRRMFHRRPRRHDSFTAISNGFRRHHFRRPRNAHRPLQPGNRKMDSRCVQPDCTER